MNRSWPISVDLSVAGFERLEEELYAMRDKLNEINESFLTISADYIADRARMYVEDGVGHGVYTPTGELANSIRTVLVSRGIRVVSATSEHAAYREFGIGIVGASDPHEWASEIGWEYDVDSEFKADDRSWIFGGKPYKGYTALRFMYNAMQDYLYGGGKEECMRSAMEVFGR